MVGSSGWSYQATVEAGDPFVEALVQSQVWLQHAHRAMLDTLEAQLKHMRHENMRLRTVLEEAGLGEKAKGAWLAPEAKDPTASSVATVPAEAREPPPSCPGTSPSEAVEVPAVVEAVRDADLPDVAPTMPAAPVAESQMVPEPEQGPESMPRGSKVEPVASAHVPSQDLRQEAPVEVQEEGHQQPRDEPAVSGPGGEVAEKTEASTALPRATAEDRQPPVTNQSPPSATPAMVARALEASLAAVGWQHLQVEVLPSPDPAIAAVAVKISGAEFLLRLEQIGQSDGEGTRSLCLLASGDGGANWEALESLLRRRRLHKVVRAAPIATRTVEFAPEEAQATSPLQIGVAAKYQPKSLSLAELANLPLQPPSCRVSSLQRPKPTADRHVLPGQPSADSNFCHHKVPAAATISSHR